MNPLIVPYSEEWKIAFNQIAQVIGEALLENEVTIEHVGSTAVKGLAAKPIIDIDIVFGEKTSFEDIKNGLVEIGYYHNGNQGVVDREAFKRNSRGEKHHLLDAINHHLYVCPSHSAELKRHLLFRDYLIENKSAQRQYEKLKFSIAKKTNQDKRAYAELKETMASAFIEPILEKAKLK